VQLFSPFGHLAVCSVHSGAVTRLASQKKLNKPRRCAYRSKSRLAPAEQWMTPETWRSIFPLEEASRVPPEVYKTISDSIQSCQLSGADPKQTAEEGGQQIDSFLAGYTGAPLL
jgi:multiple sugar transport system substrate-binding protein